MRRVIQIDFFLASWRVEDIWGEGVEVVGVARRFRK